ncbi:LuxR C-terminal-related transcriptional regulator [Cronobacter turicensis]
MLTTLDCKGMTPPEIKNRIMFDIVTMDFYLQSALQHIFSEGHELDTLLKLRRQTTFYQCVTDELRIALIDVRCLYVKNDTWMSIVRTIKSSDFYILMSWSEVSPGKILHLSLKKPIGKIKSDLTNMLKKKICNRTRNEYHFTSAFSMVERTIFVMMANNVDNCQVQALMDIKKKNIYQVRSRIMKKLNVTSKKELYIMLKLYDFFEYLNNRGSLML